MSALVRLRDLVWPVLEDWKPGELWGQRHANRDDVEAIARADWSASPEVALEEARRIAEEEERRRQSAEGRASTYLLVAAALVPLLTSLENAVWDQKMGTAPKWLTLPILALGVLYTMAAGVWAFRTLTVGTFVRVGETDMVKVWQQSGRDPQIALVAELLKATRRNRDTVNAKVSAIKMAHAFMVRGFLAFGLMVLAAAGWGLWQEVSQRPSAAASGALAPFPVAARGDP